MRIILNGKKIDTQEHTAFNLRKTLNREQDILILNGYQLNQDHPLNNGDLISLIPKGTLPPREELESMLSARHTPKIQQKLKEGRVAIAGLGGLGSNIAVMLTRIGVGHLLLIDFDIVEPSNLNRQAYFQRHLGMYKTEALLEQLTDINPFTDIKIQTVHVTRENITELLQNYPIICEAFDDSSTKAMLCETVLSQMPDKTIVAASGMAGYGSSNQIRTMRRMKKLYLCGDLETEAKIGTGLMAPRVQICAGHQANMILRLLTGIEDV